MIQKNQKGFTVIELMIVIAIIGILASVYSSAKKTVVVPVATGTTNKVDCIEGYKFITQKNGETKQMLNEANQGIACVKDGDKKTEPLNVQANPYNDKK